MAEPRTPCSRGYQGAEESAVAAASTEHTDDVQKQCLLSRRSPAFLCALKEQPSATRHSRRASDDGRNPNNSRYLLETLYVSFQNMFLVSRSCSTGCWLLSRLLFVCPSRCQDITHVLCSTVQYNSSTYRLYCTSSYFFPEPNVSASRKAVQ